jgi:hypothetical protein
MTNALFMPAVVLMLITFLVWLQMFLRRIIESRRNKIHPQKMVTPEGVRAVFSDRAMAASNCFKNLLEVPLLFYVVCIFITLNNQVDGAYVNMAWAFVVMRSLQAGVHCTYNRVMHRFIAYVLGSMIAWAMIIRFAFSIL